MTLSETPISERTQSEEGSVKDAPDAVALPAAQADVTPIVRERRSMELGPRVSIDTLLSAPVPADRADLQLEDRLDDLTLRVQALEERTRRLEFVTVRPEREPRPIPSWMWIAFLVALALIAALVRLAK